MPHICKRNKIYYVFWYENKKHHCKAISPSYREAEKWASMLTLRLYSRKNGMPVRFFPFKDFVQEYIKEYTNFKAPRTQKKDLSILNNFFRLLPNIEYTSDFNELILKQYISLRLKENKAKATINRELGLLKNMQKVAFEKGYLETNVATKTKTLKINTNIPKYLPTDEEIETIFSKLTEPIKTVFILGLTCGVRRGEACHIELDDIDFYNNIIHIKPKPHLNWYPKNNTSIRDVPIHPQCKEYLVHRVQIAQKLKSNLLCCYEDDGRPLNEDVVSSMITKIRKKYKINKKLTLHTLRRKFITITANQGVPMIQVKNIVGHSTIKTTESIYYQSVNEKNVEAISTVEMPLKIDK